MQEPIVWTDYFWYLVSGAKKEGMNAFVLSVLKAVQYVVVAFLAIVAQQIYDSLSKGTFELFNWAAWQSYLLPGFVFVVGFINEILRKWLNPAVSLKYLAPPQAARVAPSEQFVPPSVSIRHVEPPEQ